MKKNNIIKSPLIVLVLLSLISCKESAHQQWTAFETSFETSKQYTKTNVMLNHDFRGRTIEEIPLEPSGLIGPVTVEVALMK
jgi:hypothetical protein